MTTGEHRLFRLLVDFSTRLPPEPLQDRVSAVISERLTGRLQRVFDELFPRQQLVLDRLEIDVGRIRADRLETDLPEQVEVALRKALQPHVDAALRETELFEPGTPTATADRATEVLLYFLEHGVLPWWTNGEARQGPSAWLRRALRTQRDWLAAELRQRMTAESVRKRMVLTFDDAELAAILRVLSAGHVALGEIRQQFARFLSRSSGSSGSDARTRTWVAILHEAAQFADQPFEREKSLARLATCLLSESDRREIPGADELSAGFRRELSRVATDGPSPLAAAEEVGNPDDLPPELLRGWNQRQRMLARRILRAEHLGEWPDWPDAAAIWPELAERIWRIDPDRLWQSVEALALANARDYLGSLPAPLVRELVSRCAPPLSRRLDDWLADLASAAHAGALPGWSTSDIADRAASLLLLELLVHGDGVSAEAIATQWLRELANEAGREPDQWLAEVIFRLPRQRYRTSLLFAPRAESDAVTENSDAFLGTHDSTPDPTTWPEQLERLWRNDRGQLLDIIAALAMTDRGRPYLAAVPPEMVRQIVAAIAPALSLYSVALQSDLRTLLQLALPWTLDAGEVLTDWRVHVLSRVVGPGRTLPDERTLLRSFLHELAAARGLDYRGLLEGLEAALVAAFPLRHFVSGLPEQIGGLLRERESESAVSPSTERPVETRDEEALLQTLLDSTKAIPVFGAVAKVWPAMISRLWSTRCELALDILIRLARSGRSGADYLGALDAGTTRAVFRQLQPRVDAFFDALQEDLKWLQQRGVTFERPPLSPEKIRQALLRQLLLQPAARLGFDLVTRRTLAAASVGELRSALAKWITQIDAAVSAEALRTDLRSRMHELLQREQGRAEPGLMETLDAGAQALIVRMLAGEMMRPSPTELASLTIAMRELRFGDAQVEEILKALKSGRADEAWLREVRVEFAARGWEPAVRVSAARGEWCWGADWRELASIMPGLSSGARDLAYRLLGAVDRAPLPAWRGEREAWEEWLRALWQARPQLAAELVLSVARADGHGYLLEIPRQLARSLFEIISPEMARLIDRLTALLGHMAQSRLLVGWGASRLEREVYAHLFVLVARPTSVLREGHVVSSLLTRLAERRGQPADKFIVETIRGLDPGAWPAGLKLAVLPRGEDADSQAGSSTDQTGRPAPSPRVDAKTESLPPLDQRRHESPAVIGDLVEPPTWPEAERLQSILTRAEWDLLADMPWTDGAPPPAWNETRQKVWPSLAWCLWSHAAGRLVVVVRRLAAAVDARPFLEALPGDLILRLVTRFDAVGLDWRATILSALPVARIGDVDHLVKVELLVAVACKGPSAEREFWRSVLPRLEAVLEPGLFEQVRDAFLKSVRGAAVDVAGGMAAWREFVSLFTHDLVRLISKAIADGDLPAGVESGVLGVMKARAETVRDQGALWRTVLREIARAAAVSPAAVRTAIERSVVQCDDLELAAVWTPLLASVVTETDPVAGDMDRLISRNELPVGGDLPSLRDRLEDWLRREPELAREWFESGVEDAGFRSQLAYYLSESLLIALVDLLGAGAGSHAAALLQCSMSAGSDEARPTGRREFWKIVLELATRRDGTMLETREWLLAVAHETGLWRRLGGGLPLPQDSSQRLVHAVLLAASADRAGPRRFSNEFAADAGSQGDERTQIPEGADSSRTASDEVSADSFERVSPTAGQLAGRREALQRLGIEGGVAGLVGLPPAELRRRLLALLDRLAELSVGLDHSTLLSLLRTLNPSAYGRMLDLADLLAALQPGTRTSWPTKLYPALLKLALRDGSTVGAWREALQDGLTDWARMENRTLADLLIELWPIVRELEPILRHPGTFHSIRELRRKHVPAEAIPLAPLKAPPKPRPAAESDAKSRKRSGTTGDVWLVEIAGLVILWPYFDRLFELAGLMNEEDGFVDEAAQQKAIHLLYYLATRSDYGPEYQLVLCKVLCGWPLDEPVPAAGPPDPSWPELCDSMMQAVIGYWTALGESTPEAVRETFVQREGHLSRDAEGWLLQISEGPYDILVRQIPWGVSLVNLSWIEQPVTVEWR